MVSREFLPMSNPELKVMSNMIQVYQETPPPFHQKGG